MIRDPFTFLNSTKVHLQIDYILLQKERQSLSNQVMNYFYLIFFILEVII